LQVIPSSLAVSTSHRAAQACPDSSRRLRQLVDAHFPFVWRTLRRGGVSEADADDAAQRVFLTLSRRLAEIRPGAERAFIYAVAQGEASHLRRSYKRRAEVGQEPLEDRSTGRPRPDELVARGQALSHARRVLDDMEEPLRQVFVLFEVEDLSCQEIANVLSIPLGTVKSRLLRAREGFRARMAELSLTRSSP
jgi:RNA polymerase sigma-70 factor, ECF subfamily